MSDEVSAESSPEELDRDFTERVKRFRKIYRAFFVARRTLETLRSDEETLPSIIRSHQVEVNRLGMLLRKRWRYFRALETGKLPAWNLERAMRLRDAYTAAKAEVKAEMAGAAK